MVRIFPFQARSLPTPYPKHYPFCRAKLGTSLLRHLIQYGGQQLVDSACPDFGTAFPKFNATNRTCCTQRQSGKIKVLLPFERCPN